MTEKFKNKYRIESTRLPNWDYGWNGTYFITICTKYHVHYLGEIIDDVMQLSEIGKIAEHEWLKTVKLRPDMNIALGPYIIMPNHIHGIIIIGENEYNNRKDAIHGVSTD